jgi:4-hydroxy-2-oxoheptanedioate aldolase
MGIPGQFFHADLVKAFETTVAACKKHKKWAGLGGIYNEEGYRKYIGIGVRLVLAGSDLSFLMAGAAGVSKLIRTIK